MTSDERVYVHVYLPGQTKPLLAGRLQVLMGGAHPTYSFEYHPEYIVTKGVIPLHPVHLKLLPGAVTEQGLTGKLEVMRDASPDNWGRAVIQAEWRRDGRSGIPSELAVLAGGGRGIHRIGALEFSTEKELGEPEQLFEEVSLDDLHRAARSLETGEEIARDLLRLLRERSSLGGARPKATVWHEGAPWLAKFALSNDPVSMARVEAATLDLARHSGIEVPDHQVIDSLGREVLLVRRFDREELPGGGWGRRHFLSGLAALGCGETGTWRMSYPELADEVRRLSADFSIDGPDLYRRMVFNVLVGNTDDHARNHGLLYAGDGLFRLSPAYDLVPQLHHDSLREQAMIIGGEGRASTVRNLLSEHSRFGLTHEGATMTITEVAGAVRSWRAVFEAAGVSPDDRDRVAGIILPPTLADELVAIEAEGGPSSLAEFAGETPIPRGGRGPSR